ncbi:MAG: GDSL-type esterase/lipase family protein [Bacteroidota bacterium]
MRSIAFFLLAVVFAAHSQSWDSIPRLPEHYKKRTQLFAKEKASTGKILFLGNSITEGGDWKKLLGDSTVVNRGIGGDVTFGVLKRLDEVARFKPSKVFLLIGINDLSKGIPEEVVLQNIFTIVSELKTKSPGTTVFVQSLLPVNPSFKNFPAGYALNESVIAINTQLSKIEKKFGYTYIDIFKGFADKDGLMTTRFSTDGLHLNLAGYQHWVKMLKEAKYL